MRVPEFRSNTPLRTLQGSPYPYATSDSAFGGAQARAKVASGKSLTKAAFKGFDYLIAQGKANKKLEDDTFVKQAFVKANDEVRSTTDKYLTNKEYSSVISANEDADKDLTDIYTRYTKDMSPDQLAQFNGMFMHSRNAALNNIYANRRSKLSAINAENNKAIIQQEIETAATSYENAIVINNSRDIIKATVMSNAKLQGYGGTSKEDVARQKVAEQIAMDSFHSQIINSALADNNIGAANAYFKANKDEMSANVQNQMKAFLSKKTDQATVNAHADYILAKSKSDYREAMAIITKEYKNNVQYSDIRREIKVRFRDMTVAKEIEREKALATNTQNIDRIPITDEKSMREIANNIEDPKVKTAVHGYISMLIRSNTPKTKPKTAEQKIVEMANNVKIKIDAMEMIDNGEIKNASQLILLLGKSKLSSKGVYDDLVEYIRKGGSKQGLSMSKVKSIATVLYGSRTGTKIAKSPELWNYLERFAPVNKEIDDNWLRERISIFTTKGEQVNSTNELWYSNKSYAEALKDGTADKWLPLIDDEQRQQTLLFINQQNELNKKAGHTNKMLISPTEEQIRRVYRDYFLLKK